MTFWPRTEILEEIFEQSRLDQRQKAIPQLQSQVFNNIIPTQKDTLV